MQGAEADYCENQYFFHVVIFGGAIPPGILPG
ncbi:hypothetical protein RB2501_13969 [Robiginitalea biformata HTCC2501]|uniref:Uncharacterized protein n=1 Tax=Robiginitalea biformata (strain ATCC BAA-864 / DSM 15991 / KCTC 12146 / HTCC2501) TaxID=313596 RepID=A4CKP1_ROBBH|nr:hypothetical protein RB2501_13969 [Robiginitalea biformata HTCC2501]